jgi:L-iditol 2-dehydrogenase
MRAIRLYGPTDLRLENVAEPAKPGRGEVLLRPRAVGICGSDLHTYQDGRIGDTAVRAPLILGHEFAGVIEAVGEDAISGAGKPLAPHTHVAVDPAISCGRCELCEKGHPNLCLNIRFCGLFPDDGALQERMIVPAGNCFPISEAMDFGEAALLETLGVALHAADLSHIRVGDAVAILGAGPIGLCILQVAQLAGASPIYVTDKFPWRLALVERFGGIPIRCDGEDPVEGVLRRSDGRGVDVAIEAAWADQSIQQAADMTRNGGRLTLVGIPGNDQLHLQHSVARRKGLTIRMARHMKHVYPRAIALHQRSAVDLTSLISHRFPLEKTAEAFEKNIRYDEGVVKIVIDV